MTLELDPGPTTPEAVIGDLGGRPPVLLMLLKVPRPSCLPPSWDDLLSLLKPSPPPLAPPLLPPQDGSVKLSEKLAPPPTPPPDDAEDEEDDDDGMKL